jgi:hypothetical protein
MPLEITTRALRQHYLLDIPDVYAAQHEQQWDGLRVLATGSTPSDHSSATLFQLYRHTAAFDDEVREGIVVGYEETTTDAFAPYVIWDTDPDYDAYKQQSHLEPL